MHPCLDWNFGGETKITNGCLLCRWHHTYTHTNHWTVRLDEHQKPVFKRPEGTVYQHESQRPQLSAPADPVDVRPRC